MSKATIYRWFASKEALFSGLLEHRAAEILESCPTVEEGCPPAVALENFLRHTVWIGVGSGCRSAPQLIGFVAMNGVPMWSRLTPSAQIGHVIVILDKLGLLWLFVFHGSSLQEIGQWNYADLALRDCA
jgi:AcrR family transcriptional regulator